jgi:DNA-binding IclR family transcriptional regulator
MLTPRERTVLQALAPRGNEPLQLLSHLDIANRTGIPLACVVSTLWSLKEREKVLRNESGCWRLSERPRRLTEAQAKLFDAVRRSSPDVKVTDLARRAGVHRSDLRARLDELVALGAIAERSDGWYEVLR